VGFPCNQFLSQEPDDAASVDQCVRVKHGVGFPLMEKVDVNGPETHPVWQWLRMANSSDEQGAIPWNFQMFLVGPDGQHATRFANTKPPLAIRGEIEASLHVAADGGLSVQSGSPDAKAKMAGSAEPSPASVMAS